MDKYTSFMPNLPHIYQFSPKFEWECPILSIKKFFQKTVSNLFTAPTMPNVQSNKTISEKNVFWVDHEGGELTKAKNNDWDSLQKL